MHYDVAPHDVTVWHVCAKNRQIDSSGPDRSSDVFVFVKYFKLTLQQDILQ